jgi:hypothetical protein
MFGTKVNQPDKMLLPDEIKAVLMSLEKMVEDLESAEQLQNRAFNAEAKKTLATMLANVKSAKQKLEKHTGAKPMPFPEFVPGDEDEFLEPIKIDDPGIDWIADVENQYQLCLKRLGLPEEKELHPMQQIQLRQTFFAAAGQMIYLFRDLSDLCKTDEDFDGSLDKMTAQVSDFFNQKEAQIIAPPPDEGTPKLKRIMHKIEGIVMTEDVAAMVVLHTPGFSEFFNHIMPSYSCMKMVDNEIRMVAKLKEDFGGDKDAHQKKVNDTVNMISHFADVGGQNVYVFMQMMDRLKLQFDITEK